MEPTFTRAPEPEWTPGEQLRFLVELIRATLLQTGTLQHNPKIKLSVRKAINLTVKKLEWMEKELCEGRIKNGQTEQAEAYWDNQSSLCWEALNELRKMKRPADGLVLLLAYNNGTLPVDIMNSFEEDADQNLTAQQP